VIILKVTISWCFFPMTLLAQPLILPEISMAETDKVEAGRSLDKTENALL
jgi:hypothetical protein